MNNEIKLKQEFEEFIDDLIKDIIKSVLYEDFKALNNKFEKTNNQFSINIKNADKYNKILKRNIDDLNTSSNAVKNSSKYLKENIEKLNNDIKIDVEKNMKLIISNNQKSLVDINRSISQIKTSVINNNKDNIERLSEELNVCNISIVDLKKEFLDKDSDLRKQLFYFKSKSDKFFISITILLSLNTILLCYIVFLIKR